MYAYKKDFCVIRYDLDTWPTKVIQSTGHPLIKCTLWEKYEPDWTKEKEIILRQYVFIVSCYDLYHRPWNVVQGSLHTLYLKALCGWSMSHFGRWGEMICSGQKISDGETDRRTDERKEGRTDKNWSL